MINFKLLPNAGNSADTFAIYSPELANLAIELTKRLTPEDTSGISAKLLNLWIISPSFPESNPLTSTWLSLLIELITAFRPEPL